MQQVSISVLRLIIHSFAAWVECKGTKILVYLTKVWKEIYLQLSSLNKKKKKKIAFALVTIGTIELIIPLIKSKKLVFFLSTKSLNNINLLKTDIFCM